MGRFSIAQFESLDRRILLAAVYPTALEQYMVELINRARANPAAEAARLGIDLNEGLSPGALSAAARQPLAINPFLTDAARDHVDYLLANSVFSHTGAGGSSPGDRMAAAGYSFTGSFGNAENLSVMGPVFEFGRTANIETLHNGLFTDFSIAGRGHRINMLGANYREIGSGVAYGNFTYNGTTTYVSQMSGTNFAYSGNNIFLTGVAYSDAVTNDDFYTVGEALAGVTITARSSGGTTYQTTTWDSGGYALALPAGTYDITATGGGLGGTVSYDDVVIGSQNVKRDFRPELAQSFASLSNGVLTINGTSGDDVIGVSLKQSVYTVTMGGASVSFASAGVSSLEILCGDGNDRVDASSAVVPGYMLGGAGNDTLIGGIGNDTLSGGGGKDSLVGNAGNDRLGGMMHNDTLNGGDDDDRLYGDDGNDLMQGGGGVDRMWAGDGDDQLEGGAGNDKLYGEAGVDNLFGGKNNDYLDGGSEADNIFGGDGTDSAITDALDSRDGVETLL